LETPKSYTVTFLTEHFEKEIENVIADGVTPNGSHRFLICKAGERVELPIAGAIFTFSKERSEIIQADVNAKLKAEQEHAAALQ
jgi:hypothetical protein